MSAIEYLSPDQLKKFQNKDGIIEIVARRADQKFKAFHKIILNNAPETETKELINKAFSAIKNNSALTEKSIKLMSGVSKLQKFNIALGALNLCATCVGFAVMYTKLDNISSQINKVITSVKLSQDITASYEFNKVISEHSNMLDCRKTLKYYSEEQMRKLVDDEYNVLDMLIKGFLNDHTADKDNLIISIYSMASMMTVSLRYFDEVYYLNNKETIGDGEVWHSSHKKWVDALNLLLSDEFVEKIQDHGIFDLRLSTIETDIYYKNLCDQVRDMKESIEDNQFIVKESDSSEQINEFETELNHEVKKTIQEAFEQTSGVLDNAEVKEAYINTLKQMGLAV